MSVEVAGFRRYVMTIIVIWACMIRISNHLGPIAVLLPLLLTAWA